MKAVGMLLIVYGHASAGTDFFTLDPIRAKQLGVALFIFVIGFGLSRERRPTDYVLFSRLFTVFLYGFAFALLLSAWGLILRGDPAESNYLPFFLGANVFLNDYPANQPTWYIGTYLHIMLAWGFVLRKRWLRWWSLLAWIPLSIAARALLIAGLGPNAAYMLITNWISIFLLGYLCAELLSVDVHINRLNKRGWLALAGGLGVWMFVIWPSCVAMLPLDSSFPFGRLQLDSAVGSLWASSALAEFVYFVGVLFIFSVSLMLPRVGAVEFIARNTLLIFIVHMPLIRGCHGVIGRLGNEYFVLLANVLVYYIGLAFIGELLGEVLRRGRLKSVAWEHFHAMVKKTKSRLDFSK